MATYNPHFNLWILGSDEKDFIIPKIIPIDHPGFGVLGNNLDNSITGSNGHDIFDGGLGNDTMAGGYGNDVYVLDNANDVVIEEANQGYDSIKAYFDFDLSTTPNVEGLFLMEGGINGRGNDANNTIFGNNADNNLWGGKGDDLFAGGSGDDHIWGEDGNDYLQGGFGADTMEGGAGDDQYTVDNNLDVLVEKAGEGTDTVHATITHVLQENFENLVLQDNTDAKYTNDINGVGNTANNRLTGNSGKNILIGNEGHDTIDGGAGADRPLGGAGDDAFVFSTALGYGNVDFITDFNVADDQIWLDSKIFKSVDCACSEKPMALKEKFFTIGDEAKDKDDFIIYQESTGILLYDADGSGTACKAVAFAKIGAGKDLSHLDFVVI